MTDNTLKLRHPQFTSMNFFQLEEFVLSDFKHRFELSYHPKRPEDPWWIRAKGWKVYTLVLYSYINLTTLLTGKTPGLASNRSHG